MTTIVILNIFFVAFVIVGIVGLLGWSIVRENAGTVHTPARVRRPAAAAARSRARPQVSLPAES